MWKTAWLVAWLVLAAAACEGKPGAAGAPEVQREPVPPPAPEAEGAPEAFSTYDDAVRAYCRRHAACAARAGGVCGEPEPEEGCEGALERAMVDASRTTGLDLEQTKRQVDLGMFSCLVALGCDELCSVEVTNARCVAPSTARARARFENAARTASDVQGTLQRAQENVIDNIYRPAGYYDAEGRFIHR